MPGVQMDRARLAQGADGIDLNAFRVTLQQLLPFVFFALDTSASMNCRYGGWTIWQQAAAGFSRVIRALPLNSLVNVMGFGDKVYPVFTPFLAPVTVRNRAVMEQTVQGLRPDGGTALYDTLVSWSLVVLSLMSRAQQQGLPLENSR